MATVNRLFRRYTDINLLLEPHPYTKDVLTRKNYDAVKTSVRNLILTKNYERPFHPEIGCQVTSLLFENLTPSILSAMERTITDTITKFEPRARLIDVTVIDKSDSNEIDVSVTFSLQNTEDPVTIVTTLNRVR